MPTLKSQAVRGREEDRKLLHFQAPCLQATCLQSSVTGLHTYNDTSSLCGNPLSPLGRQQWLTGCWIGLPQVPRGSHIRPGWQTDRALHTDGHRQESTHAYAHAGSLLPLYSSSHALLRLGTLCIKQWLCSVSDFFFFLFFLFPFLFFPKHKIIFHPSSLYMLHGSFEMNNGNHRAKGSWDPFKNVGEATQSGFGPQKHHAPSKWICYCSVRYGTASVSLRQPANTSAFHDGRSGTAVREGRQTGGKGLETISYSAFLSMPSTAPCNFRRGITISSVLTASLKQTNWTWFVMCGFFFHYVVSNSTSPPQILKNRMWACTWVSAGQSCSGCKVNMTPWGDFLIMNTKRMSALIRLHQYAELLTVHFPFFLSLLFHGFKLIQLCVDSERASLALIILRIPHVNDFLLANGPIFSI